MNKISEQIEKIEKRYLIEFKPTRQLYDRLGLGQKRFSQLVNNEAQPTAPELNVLANYFNCNATDLFDFEHENMSLQNSVC